MVEKEILKDSPELCQCRRTYLKIQYDWRQQRFREPEKEHRPSKMSFRCTTSGNSRRSNTGKIIK